jgi:hypothetical protein
MEERSNYARTTITVPRELKVKMKRARNHQINWSSVACEAFEAKLDELGPFEEITTIEAALERMNQWKKDFTGDDEKTADGTESGKSWAMNFATPAQLARIEKLKSEIEEEAWEPFMMTPEGWKELTFCIQPRIGKGGRGRNHRMKGRSQNGRRGGRGRRGPGRGRRGHGHPAKAVWKTILDERPNHPGFFLGFAEGALKVWDQVKDELS